MAQPLVSIITPCFHARPFLLRPVRSVLAQSYGNWELILVADDQVDYAEFLKAAGINDPRIRFTTTGKTGGGIAAAQNTGLAIARGELFAPLDHDDAFHPTRLARMVPKALEHGVASSALAYLDEHGNKLTTIGDEVTEGPLAPLRYFATNISSNSIVLVDRRRVPVVYDTSLRIYQDTLFAGSCYNHVELIYHLPDVLFDYYKLPSALSVRLGVSGQYLDLKRDLLVELRGGRTQVKNPAAIEALDKVITASLVAEDRYFREASGNANISFTEVFKQLLRDHPLTTNSRG